MASLPERVLTFLAACAPSIAGLGVTAAAWAQEPLPGTRALTLTGDLSAQMVAGISRNLDAQLAASVAARAARWSPDFSSPEAYAQSVAPNRARLARMLGIIDARVANPAMEFVATISVPEKVAETDRFTAFAVRWPVLDGVWGEGLWLQPKGATVARVVALPDADQTPELICGLAPGLPVDGQFARRLAENGCDVIVPALVDRRHEFSRNAEIGRQTTQPHREWIYRQAYVMGRHVIGFEVQTVQSALDWLATRPGGANVPLGAAGWGEGGLIALYSAAIDPRLRAVAVSGYFAPRESLWREPIYRNVFGLLREFGDAEVARLIVPRTLIVDPAAAPDVAGPVPTREANAGPTPGAITTPAGTAVEAEVERARRLAGPYAASIQWAPGAGGTPAGPLAGPVLARLWRALGGSGLDLAAAGTAPRDLRPSFHPAERQRRLVAALERFVQQQVPLAHGVREQYVWKDLPVTTPAAWAAAVAPLREKLWTEVIGRLPAAAVPANPRSRQILDQPRWAGHEVVLDVAPDVYAWGILLLPKGMKPGEKRPVVVAQHGLEGLPGDVIDDNREGRPYRYYKAFAARLAERGFIVLAPHNPYRGADAFRMLQRKANPLGLSLFSFIIAQHACFLDWLATQPNVDPARIGFYGLSYGGKTAMRVPAVLDRYALSICSGDFNEWIWKLVTTDWTNSYMFTREWEMPDFNLGNTFGYAEMAALIAPRPFMVERGHDDGVGIDEWVGFEYAKVNRLYSRLKIPQRTAIEYFNGPHTINAAGTFAFLHRHLNWPEPTP